jgi:growth arrest-specific protein 1
LLLLGMVSLALCNGERLVDNSAVAVADNQVMCEDVRIKCAMGLGCSTALTHYFAKCDRILQTDSTTCPESCLYALVALTSTEDGKRMMDVSIHYTLIFLQFRII